MARDFSFDNSTSRSEEQPDRASVKRLCVAEFELRFLRDEVSGRLEWSSSLLRVTAVVLVLLGPLAYLG